MGAQQDQWPGGRIERLAGWRSAFLSELSHEVRTPLTGVVGMTDLLLETGLTPEQREYAEAIRACAGELLDLFQQGLELAFLSLNGVRLEREEFPLAETLHGAAAAASQRSGRGPAPVRLLADPDLPPVVIGDAVCLRRLFVAMARNACLWCAGEPVLAAARGEVSGGRLSLTISVSVTRRPGSPLPLRLEGKGCEGSCEDAQGLGLGWAIIHRLVSAMGGSLSMNRDSAGCAYTALLPLELPRHAVLRVDSATGERSRAAVLLVEDNEVARRIVTHILRRNQYEVECAVSGGEALEAAARRRFDLVLMDLQMPGMDGFETAERLRGLPGFASVPILALTANVTDDCRRLCLQGGMNGFIPKPVQAGELLSAAEAALPR